MDVSATPPIVSVEKVSNPVEVVVPRNLYGSYAELVEKAKEVRFFPSSPDISANHNVVRFEGDGFRVIFCAKDCEGHPSIFCFRHRTPGRDYLANDGDWCEHVFAAFLTLSTCDTEIQRFIHGILQDKRFRNVPTWLQKKKFIPSNIIETCGACWDPLSGDVYRCHTCGQCLHSACFTTWHSKASSCGWCGEPDSYKPCMCFSLL